MRCTPVELETITGTLHPLQSSYWASIKSFNGWKAQGFLIEDGSLQERMIVLSKKLALGYSLCYIPYGPSKVTTFKGLKLLANSLRPQLDCKPLALRFDVPWEDPEGKELHGLKRLSYPIQPENTLVIDLSLGLDEVHRQMRTRAKRNIARARQSIVVRQWDGSDKELDQWYECYMVTSLRDTFVPRTKEYMRKVLSTADEHVKARLFLAFGGDQLLGGNIVLFSSECALYLFGASHHEDLHISPSYALQWYTIEKAIAYGCIRYDLYGIAPSDDDTHHLHNLTIFKTGFGGQLQRRAGCFDHVYSPLLYGAYRIVESIRFASARG